MRVYLTGCDHCVPDVSHWERENQEMAVELANCNEEFCQIQRRSKILALSNVSAWKLLFFGCKFRGYLMTMPIA